jgi:hypothetical protein
VGRELKLFLNSSWQTDPLTYCNFLFSSCHYCGLKHSWIFETPTPILPWPWILTALYISQFYPLTLKTLRSLWDKTNDSGTWFKNQCSQRKENGCSQPEDWFFNHGYLLTSCVILTKNNHFWAHLLMCKKTKTMINRSAEISESIQPIWNMVGPQ